MYVVYCDAAHDSDAQVGAVACVLCCGNEVIDVQVLDFPYFLGTTQDLEYIAVRAALRYAAGKIGEGGSVVVCADNDAAIADAARVFSSSTIKLERVSSKGNKAHKYAVRRLRQLRAQACREEPIP